MLAYANGDFEAFEALYQRHKNRIFGFLMKKLKNRTEAEEVFQTIFGKLHVARKTYRQDIPFLPWVFTITRNALIDHVRKRDAYRKYVTTSEAAVETYAGRSTSDVPGDLEIKGLSSLTETQRQALEFRFSQGLTFAEIAEQLQTTPDNSRQIISRAIRKLRKLMAGKEMDRETT